MKLALGTVQFGLPYGIANQNGQVTRHEAKSMLTLAGINGIDTLDTAISYGESESCLGEVGVDGFEIITKLPAVPDNCLDINAWVQDHVASSLSRLGVSKLHGLLLHRSEQLLEEYGNVLYQSMQNLKDIGTVEKIGVSIYAPEELEVITKNFSLDLIQAPFNLIDRRLYTTGWLQKLKDNGIEIHTRSVFLQGLLLLSKEAIEPKFMPWNNLWIKWHKWLSENNVSAIQACLEYPLSFSEIDRIVVGTDNVNQLQQIIDASCNAGQLDLPDLECISEDLINPSRWSQL